MGNSNLMWAASPVQLERWLPHYRLSANRTTALDVHQRATVVRTPPWCRTPTRVLHERSSHHAFALFRIATPRRPRSPGASAVLTSYGLERLRDISLTDEIWYTSGTTPPAAAPARTQHPARPGATSTVIFTQRKPLHVIRERLLPPDDLASTTTAHASSGLTTWTTWTSPRGWSSDAADRRAAHAAALSALHQVVVRDHAE